MSWDKLGLAATVLEADQQVGGISRSGSSGVAGWTSAVTAFLEGSADQRALAGNPGRGLSRPAARRRIYYRGCSSIIRSGRQCAVRAGHRRVGPCGFAMPRGGILPGRWVERLRPGSATGSAVGCTSIFFRTYTEKVSGAVHRDHRRLGRAADQEPLALGKRYVTRCSAAARGRTARS